MASSRSRPPGRGATAEDRERRLAKELRRNLARRKQLARKRGSSEPGITGPTDDTSRDDKPSDDG